MDPNPLLTWLVATIKSTPSLAAFQDRIFPDSAPEGTKNPCLIYQLANDETEPTVDPGPLKDGTLAYQIRIYAASRKEANALRESFRQKFQGLQPLKIAPFHRLEGTAWGDLAETFDSTTKDYGALGVIEFHLAAV